ncbi:MAG: ribosome biogenesis GTPase Der [Candidatus Acidiferrum sp.]|jgi:ribosome-associated GTPase EngA
MEKLPSLVIVGRPNVGKSTLFNRLTGTRRSIVTNEPGITRDRIYGKAEWLGRNLEIVDTGGIVPDDKALIPQEILRQAHIAISKAALLVLVVDSQAGLTPLDEELARLLRATGKPFVVAANKVDAMSQEGNAAAFHRLGVPVFPIAAEHGTGVDDLLDAALAETHDDAENATEEKAPDAVEVAIIGRPNVGKSTLLNRMVGEDRSIVSPVPGTTMDTVDTEVEHGGHLYRFVDTAGIRRKGKTNLVAEKLSVVMARRGLERCDVALLIVDGEQGVTQGDAQIASYAEESGRSVIIVMNKWDLATAAARKASERDAATTKGKAKLAARASERPRAGARANARISARTVAQSRAQSKTQARGQANRGFSIGVGAGSGGGSGGGTSGGVHGGASGGHAFGELDKSRLLYDYERMVRDKLKFLSYAPIVFLSAKTGDRADRLFPLIDQVAAARKKRISTPELNRWLKEEVDLQRGTTPKARPVRIYYMTQAKTAPPTFLIFTNQKTPLHFSYERFLENQLRAKWDFPGAPIRFVQRLRKREPRPGAPRDEDE